MCKRMDIIKNTSESNSPELKKESRLTTIIDQLLINKRKDMIRTSLCSTENDTNSTSEMHDNHDSQQLNRNKGYDSNYIQEDAEFNKMERLSEQKSTINTTASNQVQFFPYQNDSMKEPSPEFCKKDQARELSCGALLTKDGDLQANRLQQTRSHFRRIELASRASVGEGQATVKTENSGGHKTSPAGRDGLVTASFPEGGGARGQQPVSGGGAASRAFLPTSQLCDMPADALPASSSVDSTGAPIKTERVSPGLESSSSLSPQSPALARPLSSTGSSGCIPTVGSRGSTAAAATSIPFSPPLSSLESFPPPGVVCGTPAIKQIEMMTRNYSDFMRSLAAKYNNQDITSSLNSPQSNGQIRNLNSTLTCKSSSYQCRNAEKDDCTVKADDLIPSPGFEDNRSSPYVLSDFSSSHTLLSLVRTASAQSASQLENYLRGAVKRSVEGENRLDPLDLSLTNTTKRSRSDCQVPSFHDIHLCSPSARDIRDLYELLQVPFNVEGESSANIASESHTSHRTNKPPSWLTLLDRRVHKIDTSTNRTPSTKGITKQRCSSLCTDHQCSQKSNACDVGLWTVEDVVKFVSSIDSCSEYSEHFREQCIDGSTLPLLTEEHLTVHLGMKLGPALKLRSTLARKIGHCVVCMHCIHCHMDDQEKRNELSPSPSINK